LADGNIGNVDLAGQTQGNQLLGSIDSVDVQIVLQAVETLGLRSSNIGIQGLCEGGNNGSLGNGRHLPVVGIKLIASPVDGDVTHLLENKANAVVDITIWRTHVLELQSSGGHDGLLGPLHLGHDLLVGQGGQGVMGPCVGGQVVTLGQLTLDGVGILDDVGTNQEESGRQLGGLEVVQQRGCGSRGTIIKGQAPGVGGRAGGDIVTSTSIACPVAPLVGLFHREK